MKAASEADRLKREAALRALDSIQNGMVIGLGSGSTAEIFLHELAERVRAGLRVLSVPTSRKSEALAQRLGLALTGLEVHPRLDVTVDGADEIDVRSFNLIKGHGGSLLREKLVARATDEEIIIADESKISTRLGERQPVPVEVIKFAWHDTAAALQGLGCQTELRQVGGTPFVTDEGHYIVDCRFGPIQEPGRLAGKIKALVGVVEHGLFIGLAHRLIIASRQGVRVLSTDASGSI